MNFQPILITEIELSKPLQEIRGENESNRIQYGAARLVVQLHRAAIGTVDVPFSSPVLTPEEYGEVIWMELASEINAHLEEDGLESVLSLPLEGIHFDTYPKCLTSLESFLEDAPFVSVVVCTHDRTRHLKQSLPHLLKLNYPDYEVIVVDNAPSSTETYDYIQTEYQDHPRVRYVKEEQAGLSWARNCGIRHAAGDFIAFTDDDAYADPFWLAFSMQNFYAPYEVACVTGMALPYELEHDAQVWFEQYGGLGNGFKRLVFDMDENKLDHVLYPYTVGRYGAGVNMVFRTDILRKMNGFVVKINQADDISMFVRLITNGYRLVYDPKGLVYHKHREDYAGLRSQIYNYGVGLSQFLLYLFLSDKTWLFTIAPRIPAAVLHLLSPKSYKNKNKQKDYPSELTWLERKGMLVGPFKYLQYALKVRGLNSAVDPEPLIFVDQEAIYGN